MKVRGKKTGETSQRVNKSDQQWLADFHPDAFSLFLAQKFDLDLRSTPAKTGPERNLKGASWRRPWSAEGSDRLARRHAGAAASQAGCGKADAHRKDATARKQAPGKVPARGYIAAARSRGPAEEAEERRVVCVAPDGLLLHPTVVQKEQKGRTAVSLVFYLERWRHLRD